MNLRVKFLNLIRRTLQINVSASGRGPDSVNSATRISSAGHRAVEERAASRVRGKARRLESIAHLEGSVELAGRSYGVLTTTGCLFQQVPQHMLLCALRCVLRPTYLKEVTIIRFGILRNRLVRTIRIIMVTRVTRVVRDIIKIVTFIIHLG
jgi:hypothetical protein